MNVDIFSPDSFKKTPTKTELVAQRYQIPPEMAFDLVSAIELPRKPMVAEMNVGGAIRAAKIAKLAKEDQDKLLKHIQGIGGKKEDEFTRFEGVDEIIKKRPELKELSLDELKKE